MKYSAGAYKSKYDIRTFAFSPTKANIKGGTRYLPEDIEDQSNVGICTAAALVQNAQRAYSLMEEDNMKFSIEFQYLCQKKFYDNVAFPDWLWGEGSSLMSALKVAKNIGLLPASEWTHTTEEDRKLPYSKYVAKLKAIPDSEIERLKGIAAKYKIKAYASVPTDRDSMATAIDESKAGILARYDLGNEWWTAPIEPLRSPAVVISGHAVIDTNYDGNSFRIANTWGPDWADKGTAYRLHYYYKPTEAWAVYYNELPPVIEDLLEKRKSIIGEIMNYLQKIIELLAKLT